MGKWPWCSRATRARIGDVRSLTAGLLVAFLPTCCCAGGKPIETSSIGQWSLSAYIDDDGKQFSQCAAWNVASENGAIVIIVDKVHVWKIGFLSPICKLIPETAYWMTLDIDSEVVRTIGATAIDQKTVVSLINEKQLFDAVQQGRVIKASINGSSLRLGLQGTSLVIPALESCVSKHSESLSAPHSGSDQPRPHNPEEGPQIVGTGFIISREGYVATAAHVVSQCSSPGVDAGSKRIPATLVAQDQQNDLALLKVERPWPAYASLRSSARLGEGVVVFGYPLAGLLASGGNLTTGVVTALSGIEDDSRMFQISAPVQPGNSGGPLLDESGNVIGIVVSKLNAMAIQKSTSDIPQNVNFAVKSNVLISFLDARGVEYRAKDRDRALSTVELGEMAQTFTVGIECGLLPGEVTARSQDAQGATAFDERPTETIDKLRVAEAEIEDLSKKLHDSAEKIAMLQWQLSEAEKKSQLADDELRSERRKVSDLQARLTGLQQQMSSGGGPANSMPGQPDYAISRRASKRAALDKLIPELFGDSATGSEDGRREQPAQAKSDSAAQVEVAEEAALRVEILNRQILALRQQLADISQALDISESKAKAQDITIADLGKRLNEALASKVEELARYRSEFFGKLRQVLGDRKDVQIVGDRFVFQSEVLFDSGSADLGEAGKEQLAQLGRTLLDISKTIPGDIDWVLRIDGHTDSRPISTPLFASNWELSAARAISVVKYLESVGIPADRLAAAGFADNRPLDMGTEEIAMRRNRRIELKLDQR